MSLFFAVIGAGILCVAAYLWKVRPAAERKDIWPMLLIALAMGASSLEKYWQSLDALGQVALRIAAASWASVVLTFAGAVALFFSAYRGRQKAAPHSEK